MTRAGSKGWGWIAGTIGVLLIAGLPASANEAPESTTPPACPATARVPGTGLACVGPDGLWEIFAPDGRSLGFTHGPDPLPPPGTLDAAPAAARAPTCVTGSSGTYYIRVVYARAVDDSDRYSSMVSTIRSMVNNANGMVYDAAVATSEDGDLRVVCSSGAVTVANAILPTRKASASFSTIVSDLQVLGYSDAKAKYWVFYDDTGACSCAGQGHIYQDARPGVENYNNGNGVPMFAVSYGSTTTRTWLHEIGHTMGAVQDGAPKASGAGHCVDGLDIMCYDDNGPNTGTCTSHYCPGTCSVEIFDCQKNTYFDATPSSSEWLASNWNLGSRNNRFLQLHKPLMELADCPETIYRDLSTACSFRASDDSSTIRFSIAWGDGSTTTTGYAAPGTTRTYSHTWTTTGSKTISATAYDGALLSVNSKSDTITVVADTTAPTIAVLDPAAGSLYSGCGLKLPFAGARPTYTQSGCAKATVSDTQSGVESVKLYFGGVLQGTLTAPNAGADWQFEFPVAGPASNVAVKFEARDRLNNLRTSTVYVDVL